MSLPGLLALCHLPRLGPLGGLGRLRQGLAAVLRLLQGALQGLLVAQARFGLLEIAARLGRGSIGLGLRLGLLAGVTCFGGLFHGLGQGCQRFGQLIVAGLGGLRRHLGQLFARLLALFGGHLPHLSGQLGQRLGGGFGG